LAENAQRLVHELEVHQIELELQNEALQSAGTELQLALQHYADLYDFAPFGYITLDRRGAIQKMNLAAARLLGLERAHLMGARIALFVSPDSRPTFATFLQKVFATQSKEVCEVSLCPDKGEPLWVDVEAMVSEDSGNACRVVLLDVTARKRAEQALKESEQRFIRNLFESMDEGFALGEMIHDEVGQAVDFRCLEVNSAFARQMGISVAQIAGRTLREILPTLESRWIEFYDRVWRTGIPGRMEDSVAQLEKQLEVHAWRTDDHRLAATFTDVTVQRQTEQRLADAQRMEIIGRLAGGIAHDFNNLLAIILSCTEFAMEDLGEGQSLRPQLADIHTAADRAATLTRQLLAFSRRQVLQPQVIDLNRIVGGTEGMLRRLLGEDIALTVRLAPDLGRVVADPGQVEQVVMNLAVNARDAMTGGGRLTIETANSEVDAASASQLEGAKPGPHVTVSVTDSGCGMDEKTLARIYEPFFTTKGKGKGTGLGLATVYGIVKQSGGTIRVRSEPGQGTTFTVLFPRELSALETVVPTTESEPRTAATETILLVEDEELVCALTKRILSKAGYTVLTAANGVEALRLCGQYQGPLHLVLTDVIMPEMNGKELADRLVALHPNLRVLFMSGYTDETVFQGGGLKPGTHFIGKPFSPTALTRAVRQALDQEMQAARD
jgi:PAS domain S-box-containing protein